MKKAFPYFLVFIMLSAGVLVGIYTGQFKSTEIIEVEGAGSQFESLAPGMSSQALRRAPGRYFERIESADTIALYGYGLVSQDTATMRENIITMQAMDGRYLDNDTIYQTVSWDDGTNQLSISGGNSAVIDRFRNDITIAAAGSFTQAVLKIESFNDAILYLESDSDAGEEAIIYFDNENDGQFLDGWKLVMDGPTGNFEIQNHLNQVKMRLDNATESFAFFDDVRVTGSTTLESAIILGSGAKILTGTGSPEGVITAIVGSTYHRIDGGAGTSFYVKESGSGNTGWVGK